MASSSSNFTLPFIQGNPDEYVSHISSMPRYLTFNFPTYSFFPNSLLDIGISIIEGELLNPFTVTYFKIKLNVTNTPPYFEKGSISDQILIPTDTI